MATTTIPSTFCFTKTPFRRQESETVRAFTPRSYSSTVTTELDAALRDLARSAATERERELSAA